MTSRDVGMELGQLQTKEIDNAKRQHISFDDLLGLSLSIIANIEMDVVSTKLPEVDLTFQHLPMDP
jgi:hypothetical protein